MSLPSEAEVSIYVNRLADAHCAATRHLRGVKGEDPAMEWVSGIFSKVDNYDLASIFTDFLTPAETSLLKELDETFYTKHLALGQVMRHLTSTITLPIAVDRSIKDMMDDKGFKVWASASSDLVERLKKLTAKADDLPDAWFSHLTDGRVQMDLLSWSLHNLQDWMTAELRGRTTELVKSIMSNPTGLCGKALTEAKAALRDNAPDKQCGEFFELLCEAMGDVEQLTASSSGVNPFTTASRKEQSKSTERLGKATANLEYHLEDMKKDPSESIPALVGFSSEWIAEFVKHAKQAQAKAGDDQVTVAIGELKTAADKLSGLLDPCPDLSKPNSEIVVHGQARRRHRQGEGGSGEAHLRCPSCAQEGRYNLAGLRQQGGVRGRGGAGEHSHGAGRDVHHIGVAQEPVHPQPEGDLTSLEPEGPYPSLQHRTSFFCLSGERVSIQPFCEEQVHTEP